MAITQVNPEQNLIHSTKPLKRIYILTFRRGSSLQTKNFNHDGDLKDAIQRGRDHCAKMGYVFVLVRPFVVDLEHQEDLKMKGQEISE